MKQTLRSSTIMNEQLVFAGTSFRRVGFEGLGTYTLPLEHYDRLENLRALCGGNELIYLATCNRVEIYLAFDARLRDDLLRFQNLPTQIAEFFSDDGRRPTQANDLSVLWGQRAIEHLFSVAASLDSLVVGECEIAGQVRRAVDAASSRQLSGPFLESLFRRALCIAKEIRSQTGIGRIPASIASLVLHGIREHFRKTVPLRAVIVGVGAIPKKIAEELHGGRTQIMFVNRTEARAVKLAARYGGEAVSLDRFQSDPPSEIDLLVVAVRSPNAVIDEKVLRRALAAPRSHRILVYDLGIPLNVDPLLKGDPGVRLLTLADLEEKARENCARLGERVEHAKVMVREEARRFSHELRLQGLTQQSVNAMLANRLAHLAMEDQETVRRFVVRLIPRIVCRR